MHKILNEKIILNDKLIIEKAEISDGKNTFSKLRVNRPEAAAVLVFNTDTQCMILTRQFRYAISDTAKEPILEIVAGKVDPGETALQAAFRETEEEIGYRVQPNNMKLLVSCYVSPGYTSEIFHIYYATVTNSDSENESIEVVEMPQEEFDSKIKEGGFDDSKTYIAGMRYCY
jgi:ADP-ribose pyrophosphatase